MKTDTLILLGALVAIVWFCQRRTTTASAGYWPGDYAIQGKDPVLIWT